MFNLIDFSSSYVDMTVSLWFYFKNEAINFNADFTNTGDFKSFVCKVKLFGNTIAQPAQMLTVEFQKMHQLLCL